MSVEVTTKYATVVDTLQHAFAFVMDCLGDDGEAKGVTITRFSELLDDGGTAATYRDRFDVSVTKWRVEE